LALSYLGSVRVGEGEPVRIVGVINMSPESFYPGSVVRGSKKALQRAEQLLEQGADIIDIGGMSSAPYKKTFVSQETELGRIKDAVRLIHKETGAVISVDTWRSRVAEEALRRGAQVVNDVTGLNGDEAMASTIREHGASAILMAKEVERGEGDPVRRVRNALRRSIGKALRTGVSSDLLAVDPGIGFFRTEELSWYDWDRAVIAGLKRLRLLGPPIHVGVSRKSFIGVLSGEAKPERRLFGSLAAEAVCVVNGADAVRTHNVAETLQAVRVAERLRVSRRVLRTESGTAVRILEGLETGDDLMELIQDIGAEEHGWRILAKKGIFRVLLVEHLPIPLALTLKQEMLSLGGDVATPKSTVLGGTKSVDVVVFGTASQLSRAASRLSRAHFEVLKKSGETDGPELAELIKESIR
jgi:dihydropteroate synthase